MKLCVLIQISLFSCVFGCDKFVKKVNVQLATELHKCDNKTTDSTQPGGLQCLDACKETSCHGIIIPTRYNFNYFYFAVTGYHFAGEI